MGVLANPDHERFCQAVYVAILARVPKAKARTDAYREHIYTAGDATDEQLAPNARRLAGQKHISERITELQDFAAKLAGIDSSWAMVELARRVRDFNLDDYLTPRGGERFFDISSATRDELGKLAELTIEEEILEAGEETMRKVRKVKLKPYDPASIIGLMAKIGGWLAPSKVEATGKDGERLIPEYSDDDLARALSVFLAKTQPTT